MKTNRRPKRSKVRKRYLERRLYKTERRIERLNTEALILRKAIKLLVDQEVAKRKAREDAIHKALHDTAIKSAPINKGGTKNASHS